MQISHLFAALLVATSAVSALTLSGPVAPASLPKGRAGTYKKTVYTPPSAGASRPKGPRSQVSRQATYDEADFLISQPNAVYVDVGTFGTISITAQRTWVNGKSVIGSSGFGACHAIVIKVSHNVFVGHIMVWTPTLQGQVEAWATWARANGGRAWIWVPQVNGVDEQPRLVTDMTNALGGLTTKKVVRERAQVVQASKMTALAVTTSKIIMGAYEESL